MCPKEGHVIVHTQSGVHTAEHVHKCVISPDSTEAGETGSRKLSSHSQGWLLRLGLSGSGEFQERTLV